MKSSVVFSRLIEEYGSLEQDENQNLEKTKKGASDNDTVMPDDKKDNAVLMQAEERATGAVAWETYAKYLRYAGGLFWAPVIIGLLIATQGAAGQRTFRQKNPKRQLT